MRARWKHLAFLFVASVALTLVFQQRSCAASNLTLPASAAEWTLAAPQTCAAPTPAERHAWDGVLAAGRLCRANYAGSPAMRLTLYDMPGGLGGTAFDAMQRWRTQPGKMGFFNGRYFGVVEGSSADISTLDRFVVALEASLPAGNEWHR